MKEGYSIQNVIGDPFCIGILVSNYKALNRVVNLPMVKGSKLLSLSNIGRNDIGVWKIKK